MKEASFSPTLESAYILAGTVIMSAGLLASGRIKHGLLHPFAELLATRAVKVGGENGQEGKRVLRMLFVQGFRLFLVRNFHPCAEGVEITLNIGEPEAGQPVVELHYHQVDFSFTGHPEKPGQTFTLLFNPGRCSAITATTW